MITCPGCHYQMDDAPELAGQVVACPQCSVTFQLPPPLPIVAQVSEPVPPPVQPPTYGPIERAVRQIGATAAENAVDRRKLFKDWPYTIKFAMFCATVLWIAGIFGMIAFSLFASASAIDRELGNGYYLVNNNTIPSDTYWSLSVIGALLWGLLCPTVPYVMTMALLGVGLLVAKKPE